MSRCIVCNAILQPDEIIWKPEIGEHETHCSKCLHLHDTEDYDSVISWESEIPVNPQEN